MADIDYATEITFYPTSMDFGIVTNTLVSTSSLTGHTKRIELPGARWRARLSYQDLIPADARKLMANLIALRGPINRLILRDWSLPTNQGLSSGAPQISGAPTTANTFLMSGHGSDFTEGDYFSIDTTTYGRELKMVTNMQNSPAIVTFEPALRGPTSYSEYANNSFDVVTPSGKFMLTSDDQVMWNARGKLGITNLDLEFVEAY